VELKVVALAGGVGGARLAHGLYQALAPENLTVIVNTGDDFIHHGLAISPDLDTVCYTLAGLANPETGWGMADDGFKANKQIKLLGGEDWFKLGDRDLGTQLIRTERIKNGEKLSDITRDFCSKWGVKASILPMSDNFIQTKVETKDKRLLDFQEYFVHQKCQPEVSGFLFSGIEKAEPSPGMIEAIQTCEFVIICPSNPWVSIDPILSVKHVREALADKCVIAVSPLIGGNAIKGPLSKMYRELEIQPTSITITKHYSEIIRGMVIDKLDIQERDEIEAFGIITKITDILMKDISDRKRLAVEVLDFGSSLLPIL